MTAPRPDLADLERLLAEATPGPWAWADWFNVPAGQAHISAKKQTIEGVTVTDGEFEIAPTKVVSFEEPLESQDIANAALIVAAVNALPDLIRRVRESEEALDKIANPIAAMKREAEAQGARLSGMAYTIANDPRYLQQIAREAIALRPLPPAPDSAEDATAHG